MIRCVTWIGGKQKQVMAKMAKTAELMRSGFGMRVADEVGGKQKKEVDESQWVPTGKKDSSRHAISKCVKCGHEASRTNHKLNHKCH